MPRFTRSVSGGCEPGVDASSLGYAASTLEVSPPLFCLGRALWPPRPEACLLSLERLGSGSGDQVLVLPLRDLPMRPPHRGPIL